ncbi:hypothetical protein FBY40_1278 [Microbacterium sp. SLBN-154]|uniref:hypothetical protein n=1 Tax=Microbacterium sp. SLBN-154 TaxID=2768458 RepID=UPI00114E3CA2|nr:hypothetical protein [Microbacterium sp. SLBN-154]TQK18789.1 hypothetical protein FBY40_1278 [Microbacterium sp. SLBN-154]
MDLFTSTPAPAPAAPAAPAKNQKRIDLGPVRPNRLQRIGGAGLIAAPLLFTVGMLTSPQQTSPGAAGYIESLAADPALSLVSANALHYGWVALVFGALATLGLLRSRRGRIFLPIAAVMTAFGAVQMSGLLLSDWFLVSAGNVLAIEDAVLMDTVAKEWSVAIWQFSGMIGGLVGIALLSLALARAKVVSWWIAPLGFLPWIVPAFGLGPVGAILGLICYAPLVVAGVRLVSAR